MKFLAIDPAFRNFGLVWGNVTNQKIELEGWQVLTTKDKKGFTVGLNDIYNAQYLIDTLKEYSNVDVIYSEIAGGSQGARPARLAGLTLGVLASLRPKPIFYGERKAKRATGITYMTKKQIDSNSKRKKVNKMLTINWAKAMYPDFKFPIAYCRLEHVADAIAILHAALYG